MDIGDIEMDISARSHSQKERADKAEVRRCATVQERMMTAAAFLLETELRFVIFCTIYILYICVKVPKERYKIIA